MTITAAITRFGDDAQEFTKLAASLNVATIALPTISLVPKGNVVDRFLHHVADYNPNYSVFMSSKAVNLLLEFARRQSLLDRLRLAISGTVVVAVGPKTKAALEGHGIKVSFTPKSTFSSVGIGELFTRLYSADSSASKVIIPRSGASTPFLKQLLNKIGLDVFEDYMYDVCAIDTSADDSARNIWDDFVRKFRTNRIDYVVFTSASSVRAFFDLVSRHDMDQQTALHTLQNTGGVIAIGPFTAQALCEAGVSDMLVSDVHTVAGAFEVIRRVIKR